MFTTNVETVGKIIYPYVYLHNAFNEEQLQAIEAICDKLEHDESVVVGNENDSDEKVSKTKRKKNNVEPIEKIGELHKEIRNSKTAWLHPTPESNWFFFEYFDKVARLNNDFYRFDLFGFGAFQYTLYDNIGSKYDDHMDLIMGPNHKSHLIRKLSTILFLHDKNEYEGGEFKIFSSVTRDVITVEQKRGTLICFPSWMIHCVTPITKGYRKSIVAWVEGPMFK